MHAGVAVVGRTVGAQGCTNKPDRVLVRDNVFELEPRRRRRRSSNSKLADRQPAVAVDLMSTARSHNSKTAGIRSGGFPSFKIEANCASMNKTRGLWVLSSARAQRLRYVCFRKVSTFESYVGRRLKKATGGASGLFSCPVVLVIASRQTVGETSR